MKNRPKKVVLLLTVVGILAILSTYLYIQSKSYLDGPIITIYEPTDGTTFDRSSIDVKGRAERVSLISLNDRKIFIDNAGNFSEKLLLAPGYNIFTIKAEDRFGKKTTKTLELVYLQNRSETVPIPAQNDQSD